MRFTLMALLALALPSMAFAADGIAPVDAAGCAVMKARHVLNAGAPVRCERLAVVTFRYLDFAGRNHDDGRVVVLDAVAPRVQRIFAALYERRFPVAKARPMEAYAGDDNAAMVDDNTSGFNHRAVAGTAHLSLHAYGAALDLNPVENPFLTRVGATITVAPAAGAAYVNRKEYRPGKMARTGLAEEVVDIFAENGFREWGGDWDDPIDYQHFDIGRGLAERLAAMTPVTAHQAFESVVTAYQRCVAQHPDNLPAERRQICALRPAD